MKKRWIRVLMVLTMVFLAACSPKGGKDAVAKVGNEYITNEEVNKALEQYKSMYGKDVFNKKTDAGKKAIQQVKPQIVNTLINQKVIRVIAKEEKVSVSNEELEKQFKQMIERAGGDKKFKEALKQSNVTEKEFKQRLTDQIELTQLSKKLEEKFAPSDKEIQSYFNKHKEQFTQYDADHILFMTVDKDQKPLSQDEIKKKEQLANKVYDEIKAGLNFNEAAKKYSEDPGSKDKGGKLGKFLGGNMTPQFTVALKNMKPNEISKPVLTNFGYHIIKLNSINQDYKKYDKVTKDAVENNIRNIIIQGKMQKLIEEKTKALKVEVYEEKLGIEKKDDKK